MHCTYIWMNSHDASLNQELPVINDYNRSMHSCAANPPGCFLHSFMTMHIWMEFHFKSLVCKKKKKSFSFYIALKLNCQTLSTVLQDNDYGSYSKNIHTCKDCPHTVMHMHTCTHPQTWKDALKRTRDAPTRPLSVKAFYWFREKMGHKALRTSTYFYKSL